MCDVEDCTLWIASLVLSAMAVGGAAGLSFAG
jgi:hypothetical protein